ncbi:UDP-N-acetylmuramate--L-alanine ligase [Treponema sp. OttesenSCG-928-L16]|nr:UDP-N-acetylmuramate--L-alanine ligase [Treponema sp. OttesenSCG-928-L16]
MDEAEILRPGMNVHFIGIKGTGTSALAELLLRRGIHISGSDRADVFYTDAILKELGIGYNESFSADHIPPGTDLIIYSAAYSSENNPEMAAAEKLGIPMLKYTDALGAYSARFDSSGIAGVHGKTTTTAIAGSLIRAASLPAQILAGSAVAGFGGRSTLYLGDRYFVAETCEYRKHFLAFHPKRIVLTSIESDHQDYFPTYESIRDAFMEYIRKLPPGGELIFCADDPGAREAAEGIRRERPDIRLTPYGFAAEGPFRIELLENREERTFLKLEGFPACFKIRVPGRHTALDAAAALALTVSLINAEAGKGRAEGGPEQSDVSLEAGQLEELIGALEDFRGSKRRSEILGEAGGILFMDDYGHHPTAIRTTLEGLKDFYPRRRLVVSFMSHTYTRTEALLDQFASAFDAADAVLLHKIYASAREEYSGGVRGETLYELMSESKKTIFYEDEPAEAMDMLKKYLREGDLFLTLGAGDNWVLGKRLYDYYRENS